MGSKNTGGSARNAPATSEADFDYLERYPDVAEQGMNPYYHYSMHGQAEGRTYGAPAHNPMAGMAEAFGGMIEAMSKQQEEAAAEQARLDAEYAEKQRIADGTAALDQMFATKLDAAGLAQTEVDAQINDEMAYAALTGQDYSITDEERQTRINNQFSNYWSEAEEANFATHASEFGTDKHVWTLPTTRGTGPASQGALPAAKSAGGKVKKSGTILTEDGEEESEEETSTTLLGG